MVYDGTWESGDLIDALAAVNDKPDESFIEDHFSSLPVFTAEGFRHVLPMYLIYSLQHPQSDATQRIIFELSPPDPESVNWRKRVDVFSPAQKEAICAYLRYMRTDPAADLYEADLSRALKVWICS